MAVTESELQGKRERNQAAREELQRINDARVAAEQQAADDHAATVLDDEYEKIQAAIAQARGLNEKAKPVAAAKVETDAAPTVAVKAEGK